MTGRTPDESDRLADLLVRASLKVLDGVDRVVADVGLSLAGLCVLSALRIRRQGVPELAAALRLDESRVSAILDRAASQGLVDCGTPARDGSAVEVWVTEAGRRLLEHTDDRLSTYVSALTIGLWPADQRSLGEMLQQILDADVPTL